LRPGIVTIGRDPSSDIPLTMPGVAEKRMVSSLHAYVRFEGGQYTLFDGSPAGKPSVNGTYVGGRRVPPAGQALKDGDVIVLAAIDPAQPQPGTPGTVTLRFLQDCRR
jgi:pSer/pThr/pTyr-binding forkhead associated (FHA) protein